MAEYKVYTPIKGEDRIYEIDKVKSLGEYWDNDHDSKCEVFQGLVWCKADQENEYESDLEYVYFVKIADSELIKIVPEPQKENHVDYEHPEDQKGLDFGELFNY